MPKRAPRRDDRVVFPVPLVPPNNKIRDVCLVTIETESRKSRVNASKDLPLGEGNAEDADSSNVEEEGGGVPTPFACTTSS